MRNMTKHAKKLVLVDGSSYLFRAFHALPPLTNSKNQPTGAIYGVVNMIQKLLRDEQPDYFAVVFDTKGKNFRHALYPEYKANRTQMPDDLSVQIEPLHDLIRAMGLPLIAIEGVEADDVIGTLASLATKEELKTVISTGDKDLAQLVNSEVTLVNTMTGNVLNIENVKTKFGVTPNQIIDFFSLVGDAIDNVPGIPKVGPKTAAKWLEEYHTIENLIKHANEVKGKVGEYLRAHLEQLTLSQQLIKVALDVPLPLSPTDLQVQPKEIEKLRTLFQQLEFKSWLKELESKEELNQPTAAVKKDYQIIRDEVSFAQWLNKVVNVQQLAISIQATHTDPLQAELVGLAVAFKPGEAIYIPLAHDYLDCPTQLSKEWVLAKLKPMIEDPQIVKIGQNNKYNMHIFHKEGISFQNGEDPLLQSYVLNSTVIRHDVNSLALHYLKYQTLTYESIVGKGAKAISFDQVEIQNAADYAAEEADIIFQLYQVLAKALEATPSLKAVYEEIELPLVEVLDKMESIGVCVDAQKLKTQSQQIAKELKMLEEKAYILAGQTFNLGSPKQLQDIFYEKLQLPILERTPKGAPSTAESVLLELSRDYELPKIILSHRTLSKLKSTYTDKLPEQLRAKTGRIHTSYNQTVTATGRLSSTDPNLQNIPIKTAEGRKIRQAFIAPPGWLLLAADYSQIELRIMAHLSEDEGLLKAFRLGKDIHRYTASEVLGIPLEEVTSEQRRSAKAINFGLIYGMSAFGLAKQLEIDRASAQVYMDQYFKRYPGVKKYMEAIRAHAEQIGYVETLFGRRLYTPEIRSKNMARKRAAERIAINAPMQGTAADIIKKAMIVIHQGLKKHQGLHMLMQVHDELVFEVKESEVESAKQFILDCMQNTVTLSVPLIVDIGTGKNWDEAH